MGKTGSVLHYGLALKKLYIYVVGYLSTDNAIERSDDKLKGSGTRSCLAGALPYAVIV